MQLFIIITDRKARRPTFVHCCWWAWSAPPRDRVVSPWREQSGWECPSYGSCHLADEPRHPRSCPLASRQEYNPVPGGYPDAQPGRWVAGWSAQHRWQLFPQTDQQADWDGCFPNEIMCLSNSSLARNHTSQTKNCFQSSFIICWSLTIDSA